MGSNSTNFVFESLKSWLGSSEKLLKSRVWGSNFENCSLFGKGVCSCLQGGWFQRFCQNTQWFLDIPLQGLSL